MDGLDLMKKRTFSLIPIEKGFNLDCQERLNYVQGSIGELPGGGSVLLYNTPERRRWEPD